MSRVLSWQTHGLVTYSGQSTGLVFRHQSSLERMQVWSSCSTGRDNNGLLMDFCRNVGYTRPIANLNTHTCPHMKEEIFPCFPETDRGLKPEVCRARVPFICFCEKKRVTGQLLLTSHRFTHRLRGVILMLSELKLDPHRLLGKRSLILNVQQQI